MDIKLCKQVDEKCFEKRKKNQTNYIGFKFNESLFIEKANTKKKVEWF